MMMWKWVDTSQVMDHHAEFCFKMPEHVSFHEGAMCEPLSVGIHACRKGGAQPGRSILILGSGPIGIPSVKSAICSVM